MLIAGSYSISSKPGSLDKHLKRSVNRATAAWIAGVLETAGVVTIDRGRPIANQALPGS
jgi:hypothetical protein